MSCSSAGNSLRRLIYTAILLHLCCVRAVADGSSRPATAEEQAFHSRIQAVFEAALPAEPPAGWQITGQTEDEALRIVGEDSEKLPMGVDYSVEWTNVDRRQQAQDAAVAKISEVSQGQPVSEAQLKEYEQLAQKIGEAAAAGDLATVQSLQPELERKAAAMQQAYGAMDEKIAEINKAEAALDASFSISLTANQFYQSLESEAERLTVAGYPAFRSKGSHTSSNGWQEGSTLVFLGGRWFTPVGQQAFQFANEENSPHTSLQTIVVRLTGDPARTDSLVEQIDWAALQNATGR
jgi:hypothetical protein